MELPRYSPDQKTEYSIKTKKVSYKLCHQFDEIKRVCWGKQVQPNSTFILKNVSCEARPGEVMAIAGPSGAGKTTLLDILAGKIPPSRVLGHVLVNNKTMNAKHFQRISGYVTQEEVLFPFLTVRETLMYSARLKLRGGFKMAAARVSDLLKELGLEQIADARIGGESSRGISGGEKRRVSIGVDLVHDPAVILLDEPTSGLDSTSALHVALLLKSMATTQGKTIVLTIHQPSFRILELFDQILLLSNGYVLHHGSLPLLEQQLTLAGHSIPRHVNVLEFAIEVAETLVMDIIECESSDIEQDHEHLGGNPNQGFVDEQKLCYGNNQFKEVLILSQRFSNNIFRTKQLFLARMIQAVIVGFVLGTVFTEASNSSRKTKVQTQVGFFAFSLTYLLYSSTEGLPIYLQHRRILMRETLSGAYRISSYVIANTLVFLPFHLTVALLYSTPVYWIIGLRQDIDGFLYFTLVVWMVLLMSHAFVICFSALAPDYIMGTALIAGVMGSFFLFSGYFISRDDIPWYWIFMHYLSLFKYPFESFMINEYGGKRRCLESVQGKCFLYGDTYLIQQGLKQSRKWGNLGVMSGFILGYTFLCFLVLCYRSYRARC